MQSNIGMRFSTTAPMNAIASCYKSQFKGLIARQDYHVINIWEVQAELVFLTS